MFEHVEFEVVNNLKNGDKKAFREVYNKYHKSIYLLSIRYLKDHQLAEDSVQDIFIKLWITKERLNPTKSLKSYLFTCLRNHVLNMIRNQKRKIIAAYQLKEIDHPVSNFTEDELQMKEYNQILYEGIRALPARRKQVFELKMMTDLTNAQIAEKLQISIETVKVHYNLGTLFIKSHLKSKADIAV